MTYRSKGEPQDEIIYFLARDIYSGKNSRLLNLILGKNVLNTMLDVLCKSICDMQKNTI